MGFFLVKMLNPNEKEYLRRIVKQELKKFKSTKKFLVDVSPGFLAGEEKYEDFLEKLLSKLK